MTALTEDRETPIADGIFNNYDVAAATEIFKGSLVVLDSSGNAEPATDAASKIAVGRADEYVNNTGAAGDKTVTVRHGVFRWVNSATNTLTKANIGSTVYIVDDQTVDSLSTGSSAAGIMTGIDAFGVFVDTKPPLTTATGLLAANNLSDVANAATSATNLGLGTGDSPTFTDVTTTDDVTVGDDLIVTGLATVGETLVVTGDVTLNGGAGGLTMTAANSSVVCLDNSATGLVMGSSGNPNMLQFVTTTNNEKIVVEGTTAVVAFHVDLGTVLIDESLAVSGLATITGTLGVTGDCTLSGGAGGLTMTAAGSSLVCLNNSATGWVAGSSGNPNMFQLNTLTGAEKVVIEGTTTAVALHVDVGTLLVDETATITGLLTATAGVVHSTAEAIHKTLKVSLSGAQIKAAAAPITVVAAVASKMLIFKEAALKFTAGSEILVEPSAPDDFAIRYTDGSGTIVGDTLDSGILFASAGPVDAYGEMHAIPIVPGVLADRVNVPLVIHNTGTDFTGNASNDATLDVWISYMEVDAS